MFDSFNLILKTPFLILFNVFFNSFEIAEKKTKNLYIIL